MVQPLETLPEPILRPWQLMSNDILEDNSTSEYKFLDISEITFPEKGMLGGSSRHQLDGSTTNGGGRVGGIRRNLSNLKLTLEEGDEEKHDDDEEEDEENYVDKEEENGSLGTKFPTSVHNISPQDYLEQLYDANGLSNTDIIPNKHCFFLSKEATDENYPCNKKGESVVHLCVRRGNFEMLDFLVNQAGVPTRTFCNNGRSPFHDAARLWIQDDADEDSSRMIQLLLQDSPELLWVADNNGQTPLQCVPQENWSDFCKFIRTNANLFMMGTKNNLMKEMVNHFTM